MSVILFFIVLAILVLVHEFGHFLFAKKFGIRVDEFGLGFPPKLWGKKYGETEYTLNLIPFGGFVRIFGENPDDESSHGPDAKRAIVHKPRWQQAIVLFGGILFNFLFAWVLISFAFANGVPASREDYASYTEHISDFRIAITQVSGLSPAEKAGIKPGDSIIKIESGTIVVDGEALTIPVIKDTLTRGANPVTLHIKRGHIETAPIVITPEKGIVPGKYGIGIAMEDVGTMELPFHLAVYEGGKFTLHMISGVAMGLYDLIAGLVKGSPDLSAVSGPVGIAGLVGDAAKLGITYLLMFTALISINLGVINLVPFPALDGGRLFVLLLEAIRRKPLRARFINMMNTVGFVILLMIMLLVTFKDIFKYF
ncbi:MAG: site-2 protease family protein [Candidatus Pacebacteria bacterium]|jgi:regulator of sigma E protease|nr:site-2 protease family protein [Candidatus Paceibacterota bacterium]